METTNLEDITMVEESMNFTAQESMLNESCVAELRTENLDLKIKIANLEKNLADVKLTAGTDKKKNSQVKEKYAALKAKFTSTTKELDDKTLQLKIALDSNKVFINKIEKLENEIKCLIQVI